MKVRTKKAQNLKVKVDGMTITGCNLSLKERSEIEESNIVYRRGLPAPDPFEAGFEQFDRRIIDWQPCPVNEDGEELKCTSENKRLVWEYDQQFCGDILTALNDAFAARKDLAEKNS